MFKKKLAFVLAAIMMMTLVTGCSSSSDEFESPSTVKIICPYGVGGTADVVARKFALVAGDLYPDKEFIVENMTGGDGFSAVTYYVDELEADTLDLLIYQYGVAYRHDLGVAYDTEVVDFDRNEVYPIASIDDRTWILYANPGVTLEDVIAQSQESGVKMSGGNPLSDPHLMLGSLLAQEGGTVQVVPYDGGAVQMKALTDGEVDVFVGSTQAAQESVEAGTLVPILAFSEEEFTGFIGPDGEAIEVPTLGGDKKADALQADVDYSGCILPGGGFVATRVGADEQWIAEVTEIAQAVWDSEEFTSWIDSILLNTYEVYGDDAVAHVDESCEKALAAYEMLM